MMSLVRRIWIGLVFLSSASLMAPQAAMAGPQIRYSLTGLVAVSAAENALPTMTLGLYAAIEVAGDGTISGKGVITYERMSACQWSPPHPDASKPPYCRIDAVKDGSFTVSGSVLETVHRHDDDNPLKDAAFAMADARSSERLDYAPLKIRLQLTPTGEVTEQLSFWGFQEPKIIARSTGAATLGILSATIFDAPFELLAVSVDPNVAPDVDEAVLASRQHVFRGNYGGRTPVQGAGTVGLLNMDPDRLPKKTDPMVYLVHATEAPKPREFSEAEKAAIAAHEAGDQVPGIDIDRAAMDGSLQELLSGLTDQTGVGPENRDAHSPIGLLDDTRAK